MSAAGCCEGADLMMMWMLLMVAVDRQRLLNGHPLLAAELTPCPPVSWLA